VPLQTSTTVWLESALTVEEVRLGPLPLLLVPVSVVLEAWVKSSRAKKLLPCEKLWSIRERIDWELLCAVEIPSGATASKAWAAGVLRRSGVSTA